MGKLLIIAEKPSVAGDIAVALGGFARADRWYESDYAIVTSAVGHLVEIFAPEADTSGRDLASLPVIPAQFALRPIADERSRAQYNLLAKLLGRSEIDTVVNACDAGREGELIFRLIYDLAGCRKPVKRMWLQSMTADAIRDAFKGMRPGAEFDGLADAARSRSEADWLVGINGSRGITRLRERQTSKAEVLSAGRVQTPTLAIVHDREQAIRTFVPVDYWEVHGHFSVQAGTYVGKWFDPKAKTGDAENPEAPADRLFDKAAAELIVSKCSGVAPTSVTEESKPSNRMPPKLFDLTSLQRDANRRHGFSAKKTLDIAQVLYEKHKVTTYPRTDSSALPEDYVGKAIATVKALQGTGYDAHAERVITNDWVKPTKRIFDNSKISDHFAIIPTGKRPDGMSPDETKIYDMVVRRFLAAFHPPAEYVITTRITIVQGERFKASGRVLLKEGWLLVYGADAEGEDSKEPPLCKYTQSEPVTTERIELKSLKTKPPPRFTEATLLSAMESAGKLIDDDELRDAMSERGLGTPATRASIIEGLLNDKGPKGVPKEPYMRRDGKALVPSQKGSDLISFLRVNGIDSLTSPRLTGEWEHKLALMEKRQYDRGTFMGEISDLTIQIIDVIRRQAAGVKMQTLASPCPKCGGALSVGARMIECQTGCGFTLWRTVAQRPLSIAETEKLLADRYVGPLTGFLSKASKKFAAGLKLNDEGKVEFSFDNSTVNTDAAGNEVTCPTCASAMRRINGSKGYFWSCSDRESCKTTLNDRDGFPEVKQTQPCPACAKPMFLFDGTSQGKFWGCTGYRKDKTGCNTTIQVQEAGSSSRRTPVGKPTKPASKPGQRPAARPPSKVSDPFL